MYFIKERVGKIVSYLNGYIYQDKKKIETYKFKEGNLKGAEAVNFDDSDWSIFSDTDRWGGKDKNFWFRTEVEIPENYHGKTVVFEVRTGKEGQWDATNPQFLVYVNGKPVQGFDVNHRESILTQSATKGEKFSIALHAYSGMQNGLVELMSSISVLNKEVEKIYYDIKVPLEVAALLPKDDKKSIDILNYLNEAVNIMDLRKTFSKEFYSSIKMATEYLEKEFYGKFCGEAEAVATCVGHTHIDVAWLWTLTQTRQKVARSFSTALNLIEQYPDYVFMSSQPQLYKYIKEDHPEIFEQIKKRVKENRWEAEGAMWLEADCNLSSGESLIRQILFGKRFFKEEFGVDNKILWLPDVFGYSAALPQILKKSGIDYFMTTKISWNEYNQMPYDTFMWRGMDGTEVLTHFITTKDCEKESKDTYTTYNGNLKSSQVMGAWQRYQQKDLSDEVLICFGHGDGGGGTTKEMLENARRLERGIPGCPKVKIGKALDFFERLENNVAGKKKLPNWVGELYLEYHRGTYTSMARNKKYNRKSEFLYQDIEMLSAFSKAAAQGQYPQKKINKNLETILLNQFHDIIPGSSIKEVYEESKENYLGLIKEGQELAKGAINNIAGKINLENESLIVFNQLSFDRNDVVEFEIPTGWNGVEIYDNEGIQIPSQRVEGTTGNSTAPKVIFFAQGIPAKGYKAFSIKRVYSEACENTSDINNLSVHTEGFENKFFSIKLSNKGDIISIYDKINKREVLKKNERANVIQAFEDKPHNYDAWDINIYYQEKMWEVNDIESIEITEEGPIRACLKIKKRFLDSTIVQNIYVYNDSPRIDFSNTIDWKEEQILLKAAFPVDIHSEKATYEIQYGNVERPTHWNTSWDYARFEVCAHKWADLSEGDYGVSLLNDCKYGYDIKDNTMRLTLLKSANEPNPDADKEIHEFVYSLYPHAGDWKKAGTVAMAYTLNCPMYAKIEEAHTGELPQELSFVQVNKENVIIEVVKQAEDSEEIVVRMYECYNKRATVKVSFFKLLDEVKECDLMENNIESITKNENSFEFEIKPYEIRTFKVKVASAGI